MNGSTEKRKGQVYKPKLYTGKKTQTKTQGLDLEADTDFKGRCIHLEGYVFDIGMRALYKLAKMMKELERYLGTTYGNRCYTAIMTETPATFPDLEMLTIMTDTGAESPKTDVETTYPEKKNIDEAIRKKNEEEICV